MRYNKNVYRLAKTAFATVIWFFSSVIVAPIYNGLIIPIIGPKTEFLNGVLMLGGAIGWYIIVYGIVSILFWIALRRTNQLPKQKTQEPNE